MITTVLSWKPSWFAHAVVALLVIGSVLAARQVVDADVDLSLLPTSPVDAVLACVRAVGPVQVLAEKTRIALQVRMSFAAFMPRRDWLNGHLVLARRIDSPRFLRVETFSPSNVVHAFRLSGPDEVDAEFGAWLAEAYRVGAQEHLRRPP